MKSILIIGTGNFGHHLCRELAKLDTQIMVVDKSEEAVADLLTLATQVRIGDCTKPEVLETLGVNNFDLCFVCLGGELFGSALEITYNLKQMGAARVISKAEYDNHARFFLRNGADEVIYPERDIAERVAKRITTTHALDYINIPGNLCIFEHTVPKTWVGKNIREVNARALYGINVIAVRQASGFDSLLSPDYVFSEGDVLFTCGDEKTMTKLLNKDFK